MIKTEDLKELIKTVLYTGYVADEKPLSVMFVGKVGIGKSEILLDFKNNDNIEFFSDVTYMGLIKLLEENKEVRHIVIPDFLKITMKNKATSENITSAFNSLMEEGLDTISMMGKTVDFKGKQAGLITATTKSSYEQHQKIWRSMGFLSRMLVITFDYNNKSIEEIFDYIINRDYLKNGERLKLQMPIRNIDVKLPSKLARQLRDKKTSFRGQKQLQTLAMARALMDNRKHLKVTQGDINKVNTFKKYLNMEYTKI